MSNRFKSILVLISISLLTMSFSGVMAQEEVTIEWWHIQTQEERGAFWDSLIEEYTAMNPHVTIETTVLENEAFKSQLVTVMQAGDPPDLFQSWGGGVLWEFAEAGLVRDISPELADGWGDTFAAQAALNLYSQGDEYYGVPWTWGAVGMFYNKALFAEAGLDPDSPPETWVEFLDAVQALQDAGITPITLGEGEKWPGHFWWVYLAIRLGGEEAFLAAYNRDGSFADEPFVSAGEYLQQLVELDPFPEGYLGLGYNDAAAIIGNGEAAMELMGQWAPGVQEGSSESGEGIGDDLGWFPFPVVEGGAGNPDDVLAGGDGFAVGINAPDEAIDFLQFITNAENQRAGADIWIVPVVTGLDDVFEENPVMQSILSARDEASYFQLYYDQFLPPAVGQAVNDAVETIFAEVATAEEAALAIEDSAAFELE